MVKKKNTILWVIVVSVILIILIVSGITIFSASVKPGQQFIKDGESCVVENSEFQVTSLEGYFKTFIWYQCESSTGTTTDKITIRDIQVKEGDGILIVKPNNVKVYCIATSDIIKGLENSKVISYDKCKDGSSGTTTINKVILIGNI